MDINAIAVDGDRALQELGLPTNPAILDVGTGKGNFAIYLALRGFQVLTGEPATDQSHYAGQPWELNAEKAGVRDRIRFQSFDANNLPFAAGTFDAVFFFGVLHHIDEKVRTAVFREATRVASENGAVVFFEPRQALLEKLWVDDPGHPLAANPSLYAPGEAGLSELRIEGSLMDIHIFRKRSSLNA